MHHLERFQAGNKSAVFQKLARGEQSEGSTQTETHMSDFFETSVHSPDPLTVSGKAVWNGYLAGCAIFGDMNGDRKWNQGEPGSLTSPNGDWSFQASQDVEVCNSAASCALILGNVQAHDSNLL